MDGTGGIVTMNKTGLIRKLMESYKVSFKEAEKMYNDLESGKIEIHCEECGKIVSWNHIKTSMGKGDKVLG